MIKEMKENQTNIIGTGLTWMFAGLAKVATHFEAHGAAYAQLAAVIVAIFTVSNIIRGWRKNRKGTTE
jgi:hypothetical protein